METFKKFISISITIVILIVILFGLIILNKEPREGNAIWPMFRYNDQHTGRYALMILRKTGED